MKILFLKEKRSESGIEGIASYLFNVCSELNRLDIDYLVLYNDEDQFYKKMVENNIKVKLYKFPANSPKNLFNISQVKKAQNDIYDIVQKDKITHINIHFPYLLQFVKQEWKIPIIAHWHGAFSENKPLQYFHGKDLFNPRAILNSIYRKAKLFNFDKADMIICPGVAAKNTAIKTFMVPEKKVFLNPYGIEYIDSSKYRNLKKDLGFKQTDKIIISAGRVTKAKGVEDFCEVAYSLRHKSNYKFLFLGGNRSEEYQNSLVSKYGNVVQFMGMRKDINDFYKTSDLFLFLSHRESAGLVLAEAMFFSLPLVTWDIIGVNEMFKNGKNGYLCEFGDIDSISKNIINILDNEELYNEFSQASLKEASNHTIDKSALRLIKLFEQSSI